MATETIFTNDETPPSSEDTIGGQGQNDGMKWRTTASGKVVNGGRIWISAAGKPTGLRWQLWLFAGSGASTLIRDVDCDPLTVETPGWLAVPDAPVSVDPNTDYIVSRWIPTGGPHPYSSTGGPISRGTLTAAAIYSTDVLSSSPPQFEGFSNGLLFADVNLEDPGITTSLGLITETGTVQSMTFDKSTQLGLIEEVGTVQSISHSKATQLGLITEVGQALSMSFSGGEEAITDIGWTPKVGRHCTYLQQVTVDGDTNYVKRRPAIITGLGLGDLVDIRIGHTGEVYTGVDRKRDPTSNEVNVYVSY